MKSNDIRKYCSKDVGEIISLFYETVHSVNLKDYTKEQADAWATGKECPREWNESLLRHSCYVAVIENQIVGFGDMDNDGYLDRLFVHKDFQRLGIATEICDILERETSSSKFTVNASITAVPFFEARGYKIIKEQIVERQGIWLRNYLMMKRNKSRYPLGSTGI